MHIVLLGLSQPRMQELTTVLAQALAHERHDFSLLTPDSPEGWKPPPLPYRIVLFASKLAHDSTGLWRDTLILQGLAFQVIQISDAAWVKQCIQAVMPHQSVTDMGSQNVPTRWQGVCETCSDPDCERRLFSGLLQG
jgi:hypothetical protein